MTTASFEPPIIPPAQIISEMKSMGINMAESDLKKPDPRRWMDFNSNIFNILTGKPIDDAVQNFCQNGIQSINYGELYEEALSQMGFMVCMKRVLIHCGYSDFCLQDVIEPSRKRLIKMLSCVINKMRHNLMRQDAILAMKDNVEQSKEEHHKILNLNQELKQQWNEMKESEEKIEKLFIECTEESEQVLSQMAEIERQRDPELRTIEECKLSISEKEALKEKLKNEKSDVYQEQEKLSQKIVSSPERFKQDQDKLKKRVEELKELQSEKLKKLSAGKSIKEYYSNSKNASEKAFRLAKEVLAEMEKLNEVLSEVEQNSEKQQELHEQLSGLYTELNDDMNEKIVMRQSQKRTVSHQIDLRKQCGQQQKEVVTRNHEIYQEKLAAIKSQIEEMKRLAAECVNKALSYDEECNEMTLEWQEEMKELYQELDTLHSKLFNGLREFKAIFEDEENDLEDIFPTRE